MRHRTPTRCRQWRGSATFPVPAGWSRRGRESPGRRRSVPDARIVARGAAGGGGDGGRHGAGRAPQRWQTWSRGGRGARMVGSCDPEQTLKSCETDSQRSRSGLNEGLGPSWWLRACIECQICVLASSALSELQNIRGAFFFGRNGLYGLYQTCGVCALSDRLRNRKRFV